MHVKKTIIRIFLTLFIICAVATTTLIYIGITRYTKIDKCASIFSGINDKSLLNMASSYAVNIDTIKKTTKKETGKKATIVYTDDKRHPSLIEGIISKNIKDYNDAYIALIGARNILGIKTYHYKMTDSWVNSESEATYVFSQLWNGIRVNGGEYKVSVKNEQCVKIEGKYIDVGDIEIEDTMTDEEAKVLAKKYDKEIKDGNERIYKAEKMLYSSKKLPRYMWRLVTKKNWDPSNENPVRTIYINSINKEIDKTDMGETMNMLIYSKVDTPHD